MHFVEPKTELGKAIGYASVADVAEDLEELPLDTEVLVPCPLSHYCHFLQESAGKGWVVEICSEPAGYLKVTDVEMVVHVA